MNMFGVIITGRLVQTDFIQIGETNFVCNIPDADNVNHVVVFMTGQLPFPEGMGGAVYFSWPCEQGPAWHLLGYLSNTKPSTIFKVGNLKQGRPLRALPGGIRVDVQMSGRPGAVGLGVQANPLQGENPFSTSHPFGQIENHQSHMMQIGISVESLESLSQQTPALNTAVTAVGSYQEFCSKMLDNCFNFVASFAVTQGQMTLNPTETFVPLSALQQWFINFQRRLSQNPYFWKS